MLCHPNSANTPECWGKSELLKKLLPAGLTGNLVAVLRKREKTGSGWVPLTDDQRENNFWARSGITEFGCWNWTGSKDATGRGVVFWKGKAQKTPRISWMLTSGKMPKAYVCHHCDNPSCVRPDHLFEGTQSDNMIDMIRKGRGRYHRGSDHHNAVFTEKIVKEVRDMWNTGNFTATQISAKYGRKVDSLIWGKFWKHIA